MTKCKAQTKDWSRCERDAVRVVIGGGYGEGADRDLPACAQHAKLAERALRAAHMARVEARTAADIARLELVPDRCRVCGSRSHTLCNR